MDPQCSGKSAALLSEFDRRLLPLLHQHLDMTVKKKRRTVFSVQEGKTHPSAPNASFSAPVCNDAPNNSGSVFFFPPPAERHPQNADKTSGRAATACLARFCLPRELRRHRRAGRSLRPCAASRAPRSPRTLGFARRAMAMPVRSSPAPPHGFVRELFKLRLFHGPGELSADRAPAPKTPPFPRHRRFCRSAPPSGAGKIVRAFPKAAEAALLPRMFSAGAGHSSCGPLARTVEDVFRMRRTDSSSNAV